MTAIATKRPTLVHTLVLLAAFAGLTASAPRASAQGGYAITPLRPASPFDYAVPNGINQRGDITGYAVNDSSSEFHAFVAGGAGFTDLGLLGYGGTTGIAINDAQQVALDGETPGVVALFDANGRTRRIGNVDGGSSWVCAINDSGDVVGSARNGDGQTVGFSWIGGTFADLSTVPPGIYKAVGIDNARQIVGSIPYYWAYGGYLHGQAHAFLYSGGTVTDLGSVSDNPRSDTEALGLNQAADVVGYSSAADGSHHAFLYHAGSLQDLGTLPGDWASATAINDNGLIIGTLSNAYGVTLGSFVYANGTMVDLGSLITVGGEGWSQLVVTALNNSGVIVGYGVFNDTTQGFVAVPAQAAGVAPSQPPSRSALDAAQPNPFRASTAISFSISERAAGGSSRLDLFDAAGRRVVTLASGALAAGPRVVRWDGRSEAGTQLHGGVYFARLTTLEGTLTRRLVLLP